MGWTDSARAYYITPPLICICIFTKYFEDRIYYTLKKPVHNGSAAKLRKTRKSGPQFNIIKTIEKLIENLVEFDSVR